MALASRGIFVVGAKRTPFCKYGGSLRELPASHAFAAAAKDAIQTANFDPNLIDCTIIGNCFFLSQCDGGKTPRYCGIYSGVPIEKPALGVNRTCASGLQAIVTGGMEILTNSAKACLTGGTEIMTALPMLVRNVRFGTTLGKAYQVEDHIKTQFPDSYTGLTLQKMAEDLAKRMNISREDVDNFAMESHLKWKRAQEAKLFDLEVTKLEVTLNKRANTVKIDDLPDTEINQDKLYTLLPIIEDGQIVTSGNSASPADGAAALLLANEELVNKHNLTPLARLSGWACVGVDPLDTGLGAVSAVRRLMDVVDTRLEDVDLFEINETFASQTLAIINELRIDKNKVNVSGGAIALGHPVAATGARMATHLVHQLRTQGLKKVVAASSCGGGQGIALMFESV
ncbi:unnamed protein product [Colias eurytheme]|nr:unnamed protein product [Colias eurytheme]